MALQAYNKKGKKISYAIEPTDYVLETEFEANVEEKFEANMHGKGEISKDLLLSYAFNKAKSEHISKMTILKYCCNVLIDRVATLAKELQLMPSQELQPIPPTFLYYALIKVTEPNKHGILHSSKDKDEFVTYVKEFYDVSTVYYTNEQFKKDYKQVKLFMEEIS